MGETAPQAGLAGAWQVERQSVADDHCVPEWDNFLDKSQLAPYNDMNMCPQRALVFFCFNYNIILTENPSTDSCSQLESTADRCNYFNVPIIHNNIILKLVGNNQVQYTYNLPSLPTVKPLYDGHSRSLRFCPLFRGVGYLEMSVRGSFTMYDIT